MHVMITRLSRCWLLALCALAFLLAPATTSAQYAPPSQPPAPFLAQTAPIPQTGALRFERISLEEGLSQSAILSMVQDAQGFMWFGTEGGLNRYDGYQFTVYRHDADDPTTVGDDYISALYADRDGVLWIGTRNGLDRFDPDSGTFVHLKSDPKDDKSLGGKWITSIREDQDGALWVGTDDGGISRLDRVSNTFTRYQHDPNRAGSLASNSVRLIYSDSRGDLWVGTNMGLDRLDRTSNTFVHYQHDDKDTATLGFNQVSALAEDAQGVIWVGTEGGGLDRFDRQTGTFVHYRNDPGDTRSLSHDRIRALWSDKSGRLWVGTQNGLDQFNPGDDGFIHSRHDPSDPNSLSADAIWSIYQDRSNVLWVGTYSAGVNKYSDLNNRFVLYRHNPYLNSLTDNMIWAVSQDQNEMLWIGTFNGGLNKLNRQSGVYFSYRHKPADDNSISSDDVRAIMPDSDGTLWVGTSGGLDLLGKNGELAAHYRHDPNDPFSLADNRITSLLIDRDHNLWVGMRSGGLDRFDFKTRTFVHYRHNPADNTSLGDDRVWALYQDRSGALWVGTLGGINVLDTETGRFTHYVNDPANPKSLSNNSAFSFYEDASGAMWIGTWGSGLDRLDRATGTFSHFTDKTGLPDNVIYAIETDGRGYFWLSTNRGLARFDPRTGKSRNYDVRDGLQSNEFNAGAHFQNAHGEMFFGGVNGFNSFFPDQIQDNPSVPPVVITGFSKFNKSQRGSLTNGMRIPLAYDDNFISFDFATLDYTAPRKNQYAYKMEGLDPDWVVAGTRRHADYPNLRPGEYVFRVQGSNNDGVWNEAGTAIYISIAPPFWETWWFRSAVLLGLLAAAFALYRWRVTSLEARSRELEKLVEARTAEIARLAERAQQAATLEERNRLARELHDAVTQTLFSASMIADVLPRLWEKSPEMARQRTLELRQMSRGALAEMRNLLLELRPAALEQARFPDLVRQLAEAFTGRTGVPVTLDLATPCDPVVAHKVVLYRIVQEALNNIAKHAQANTVTISYRPPNEPSGCSELVIADDGVGFDPATVPGGHMGLGIMRERAQSANEQVAMESAPGKGTRVIVRWEDKDAETRRQGDTESG